MRGIRNGESWEKGALAAVLIFSIGGAPGLIEKGRTTDASPTLRLAAAVPETAATDAAVTMVPGRSCPAWRASSTNASCAGSRAVSASPVRDRATSRTAGRYRSTRTLKAFSPLREAKRASSSWSESSVIKRIYPPPVWTGQKFFSPPASARELTVFRPGKRRLRKRGS